MQKQKFGGYVYKPIKAIKNHLDRNMSKSKYMIFLTIDIIEHR